jgi:hypothetical protein
LLECLTAHRSESPDAIVNAVLSDTEVFGVRPVDDRTLLVMRI